MFSNELQYYPFHIREARSIVLTSFFTHKTISYLDLQISHRAPYDFIPYHTRTICHNLVDKQYKLYKSFFCTVESFQNNLVPNRRLLYSLNLDFSKDREYNYLRDGLVPKDLQNFNSLFVAITIPDLFLKQLLARLLEPAFEKTECKFKLLKWMVDFRPLELYFIPIGVQYSCATILYHECADSEFVMKCFGKLFGFSAFLLDKEVKVLDNLLCHARLCDFDVRGAIFCSWSLADFCIKNVNFRFVRSFLKYEAAVYYTEGIYEAYERCWSPRTSNGSFHTVIDRRHEKDEISRENKTRRYRILQILWHESFRSQYGASESLCLVWRSIPDYYVSLQEMNVVYGNLVPDENLSRAHKFYEEAIDQTVSCREPRRLSHYCRSVVRKSVYNSKHWLPDGIKQLILPTRLKSFLNLEIDHVYQENFQAP